MTGIPEIQVPEIFVDDDNIDDLSDQQKSSGMATPASRLSADMSQGNRSSRGSSPVRDSVWSQAGLQHPLSAPRSSLPSPTDPSHQTTTSAFSFELFEPDGQGSSSGEMRQRGSPSSPTQARDMLDDSVWVNSIRKSATVRRSDKGGGSHRFTDAG